ncbi:OTU domain-containing protein 3-like [Lingula anatina]|uniref:OTU domain-containing protein 3-like n=1 Tax=Lingula anatina TaxID=7574 RepID=A0A1S3I614_LINAN|nr:OTU domain-containing protein 3-like [Lingula anatina]|eukprot:XP_013393286.1 OTU domain-containing protein 3-like [Lingula anatina]
MSGRSKGSGHRNLTKGQRLDAMARKKDERAVRQAHQRTKKMESYLADDDNFGSFKNQLGKLGLELRDIPGDGNCLFRALGDQLEGHARNHYKHRLDTTEYMIQNKQDFEPFVEDDVPFERHIALLKKQGTYAGNDALVAFARLHGVNVVIHQLSSPLWQVVK